MLHLTLAGMRPMGIRAYGLNAVDREERIDLRGVTQTQIRRLFNLNGQV
jgi:hypothetical protein